MKPNSNRRIHYLRLSVTDACNLRCIYCMPETMTFRPQPELMQDAEILRLARIFARLGFDKFRLTGGEPTLRENIVELVRGVAAVPGVRETIMTTNGTTLTHLAQPLAGAGLRRINIRLDTLNPDKFTKMSRRGRLENVLDGIAAAEAAGLSIKLNAVVVRGFNDADDAVELARLTLKCPWQVRFLEVMPAGSPISNAPRSSAKTS